MRLVMPSPVGPLTLSAENGKLVAIRFGAEPPDALRPGRAHSECDASAVDADILTEAAGQLEVYFAGRLREFDLPMRLSGTPFQVAVWGALRRIPYGETATYGGVAARVGCAAAARAVGSANGRNPLAIVVPCHRVIGADGTLTGYGGGLSAKAALLALEAGAASSALSAAASARRHTRAGTIIGSGLP